MTKGVINFLCILDRKQTQIKTQTSRFTWFPKTGYVHGGSRLYIIGGMIQTLNSTQYNPTKPNVSLLHLVFLSNLLFFTLTVALALTAYLLSSIDLTLSSCFNNEGSLLFIGSHSNNDWRLAVGGCHNYMVGSWRLT